MGVFSHKIEREELKPGDHIYTWRKGHTYSHHGIYFSEHKVIHFNQPASSKIGFSSNSSLGNPCFGCTCGFKRGRGGVVSSCLNCFLRGGNVYRYEYGVEKYYFLLKFRGGTCTHAAADLPAETLDRASRLLEHNYFGKYDLLTNNCEDFAIFCKTGMGVSKESPVGRSGQVASVVAVTRITVRGYCRKRWALDVGVRNDVAKITVQELLDARKAEILAG